jgi:hypothetical protein
MVMRLLILFLILGAVVLGMLLRPGPAAVRAEYFEDPHLLEENLDLHEPWRELDLEEKLGPDELDSPRPEDGLAGESPLHRALLL